MADATTAEKPKRTRKATGAKKSTGTNGTNGTRRRNSAPMSDAHKQALAAGRREGKAVRDYLDALDTHRPKRGRRVTTEQLTERLRAVEDAIPAAKGSAKLDLIQQRIDLEEAIERSQETFSIADLEADFVSVAKQYADRKGLTYSAFREFGVTPEVLKKAGISRSG